MYKPADVGSELLGFWSRQQHAVIQCVQKSTFRNPVLLFHEYAVHHRDLSGWPSKAESSNPQPNAECLAERDLGRLIIHLSSGFNRSSRNRHSLLASTMFHADVVIRPACGLRVSLRTSPAVVATAAGLSVTVLRGGSLHAAMVVQNLRVQISPLG